MAGPATLTLAAFLALAGRCGEGIAPETLAALTRHESGFAPLALNINGPGGGTVRGIKSKAQAVHAARALYARGVSFDAGVAQINSKNFKWLGLTPETAFDPCQSVRAQAMLLQSYSQYNTGNKNAGFRNGYVGRVVTGAPVQIAQADPAPEPAAPACSAPAWDAGGCQRQADSTTTRKRTVKEYP